MSAVIEEVALSTEVHVKASELVRVLNNVAPFVEKGGLPVLGCVRLEVEGDTLTAVATDRYTLALDTCNFAGTASSWVAHVTSEDVKRITDAVKPWAKLGAEVKLDRTETGLQLDAYDSKLHIANQDHSFPKYRSLIPPEAVETSAVAVNPAFLARFAKISSPGDTARVKAPVRLSFTGPVKPVKVEIGETFVGIIMPIRVPA